MRSSGRLRVSASIRPMPKAIAMVEVPPYDTNGSVMPLGGMRLRFAARLMAHCSPNWIASVETASREVRDHVAGAEQLADGATAQPDDQKPRDARQEQQGAPGREHECGLPQ